MKKKLYTYLVTYKTKYDVTTDIFKTKDKIQEKEYWKGKMVEDINHLKIMKIFNIDFNYQKDENLNISLILDNYRVIDFKNNIITCKTYRPFSFDSIL